MDRKEHTNDATGVCAAGAFENSILVDFLWFFEGGSTMPHSGIALPPPTVLCVAMDPIVSLPLELSNNDAGSDDDDDEPPLLCF